MLTHQRRFKKTLILTTIALFLITGSLLALKETSQAEKVALSLWTGYPEMLSLYERVAKDYEESHPNVEIKVAAFPLREYERKLKVSIPTNTVAEIIEWKPGYIRGFIEGKYVPSNPPKVDEYCKGPSVLPHHLQNLTVKGKTYGVPLFEGIEVMFWNKEMFREAGLTHSPRSWQEVIGYSCKLAKSDATGKLTRLGISLRLTGSGGGPSEKWWFWVWLANGTLVKKTPSGKYHNGYDNEAGREALKLYIDLLYNYHVCDFNVKPDAEGFATESHAMFMRESWVVQYMQEHAPTVEYGAAPLPKYRRSGTVYALNSLYMTKTCKDPEVAWDFLMFTQKPEYQRYLLKTSGWIPARKDVNYEEILAESPQYRAFLEMPENYGLYTYPMIPCFDEVYSKLTERLLPAFRDESLLDNPGRIASVIAEAARQTDEILKEAGVYGKE